LHINSIAHIARKLRSLVIVNLKETLEWNKVALNYENHSNSVLS
jgi:hypothetical protein